MNSHSIHPTPGGRFGEAALWTSAGLVVLALHIGAGFYLMRTSDVSAGENAPPPAIMIELAPEPEAAMPEETQITEQTETSEEVKSDAPEPVEPQPEPPPPEPTPPPPVEEPPPPPEEITPPEPTPPEPAVEEPPPEPEPVLEPQEQQQLAELDNVEVPLPVMRPPPPVEEKKPEEPKKKVEKKRPPKKEAPASKASQEAKIDANQSDRTAAQQTTTSTSASSSMSPQRWQGRLAAHLERRKRYPSEARSRREEGTVYVRFQIDNGGNVLSVSLSRSSGSTALDQEVLSLVKRASPVPAPPAGVNKTITVPLRFTLR